MDSVDLRMKRGGIKVRIGSISKSDKCVHPLRQAGLCGALLAWPSFVSQETRCCQCTQNVTSRTRLA